MTKHYITGLHIRTLILMWGLLLALQTAHAQKAEARLSFSIRNATLEEFVKRLENSTGFSFIYGEEVKINRRITLNVEQKTLKEILNLAFANEPVEAEKFTRSNDTYKTSKKQFHKEMGIFMGTMEFFTTSLSVAVVAVGGLLIMQGQMDTVDLLTFTLYIASFVTPIRKLANFSELYANGTAGFERFLEIMRTEPELRDAPDAVDLGRPRGEIGVNDVSFSYEGDLAVLHDVSLQIPAGQTVAIVGPSGGGKSTLCQLIPRFYDVSSGSITIDGLDVRSVTQQSLRRSIGIVQQEVFLFADSILENIRYGKPDAEMDEIVEAAKRAEIYDDIMAMPDGFDTYVGERGTLLSGGQKQRIAIAGVIAMEPKCIVLDEPTAMLDPKGRREVMETVLRLNREKGITVILITHHMDEAAQAGRVVVLHQGQIAADGTPKEGFSQVDLLHRLGLAAPDTVELCWELDRRGFRLPLDRLTIEECGQALYESVKA